MAQQSLEKGKIRFLLLEGVHPSAIEMLNRAGYFNIEQHSKALPPEEL
ncbi:MAG: phosphoglycerate dehydrogenase, partial [Halieaceae bacterium]|nr:phosphoglycerate dehydrogenase [Halieaceae bacterium]